MLCIGWLRARSQLALRTDPRLHRSLSVGILPHGLAMLMHNVCTPYELAMLMQYVCMPRPRVCFYTLSTIAPRSFHLNRIIPQRTRPTK